MERLSFEISPDESERDSLHDKDDLSSSKCMKFPSSLTFNGLFLIEFHRQLGFQRDSLFLSRDFLSAERSTICIQHRSTETDTAATN